ncbi:MAG TPA: diguanylate cyclase [Thermoanaerobaculia bacterium]|nr:diguanylate cyclase [Thermoanaerobaculia bacterium]
MPSETGGRGAGGPAQQLEVLNEIARIATLDLELRPMLQRVTDALQRRFDWQFVACVSVDQERGVFVCEAVSSRQPTTVAPGYSRPLGSGVVGEVAASGRPILLNDVRTAANYVETLPGARSELCVPVRHGGRIVAILNLESERAGEFHDQLPLVETIAEQVAGAIANARLYLEVQRRARLLEMVNEVSRTALEAGELDLLLDRIVHYVYQQFAVALVSILLVAGEGSEFELAAQAGSIDSSAPPGARWRIGTGVVGRALRLGEPQLVLDVRQDPDYLPLNETVVAELVLPIRFREQTLGVFDLESTTVEAFSAENLVVFRTFADQLAGAIHMAAINRRLEEANARLQEANERLQRLSSIDGLTGIANRRQFDATLNAEWRRAVRAGTPLALVLIDIDDFKRFNDAYGHQRGDDCLQRVAGCLRARLQRAGDLVARYGGEEFVVVLPATAHEAALATAEALRAGVEGLGIEHGSSSVAEVVTVSLGVAAALPAAGRSPEEQLAAADRALYLAKREGKNCVRDGSA